MNLIAMDNVSKSYGEKILLEDINFGIDDGEKIGLLGINGSGKSTFLKLIAGREEADRGQVIRKRNLRMDYLPQNPPYDPEATVMETVLNGDAPVMRILQRYRASVAAVESQPDNESRQQELLQLSQQMETMDGWTVESDVQAILTRLGIVEFAVRMGQLSGGQRKRVALAAALINPGELLILDEPTNHLDNQAIDWLEKYLQKFSGALLMVTHDRYFLERVSNRIIEVERGHLYNYPGNYSTYLERKLEREEIELAMADKKQSLLRKELAWIRKGARARSTKQKARIERFEKLEAEPRYSRGENLQMGSTASRLGKKTIILEDISQSYGEQDLIKDYSCILDRDERLGIVGPNGVGKSTLLGILKGEIIPQQGRMEAGSTVKIGYFPQESTDLPDDMRVIDYIREAGEYLPSGKKMLSAGQMLETFLFPAAVQWNTLQKLSGGEKRRLHLLRILMGAPNVLLLDEPGNDLDIDTLTILEDYLDDFPGAVVAVSHDRYFLDRIADKILVFEGGRIIEYPGNYSDYQRLSAAQEEVKIPPEPTAWAEKSRKDKGDFPVKALKFSFKEQKEFAEIDDKIAALEEELNLIAEKINQAASDYQLLESLAALRQETQERYENLMERWVYLNQLAEDIARQKQP